MTTIFRRILLWMFCIFTFSLVAWVTTTYFASPVNRSGRRIIEATMRFQLDSAVRILETQGQDELRKYLNSFAVDSPVLPVLLDSNGRDLATGELRQDLITTEPPQPRRPFPMLPPPSGLIARVATPDNKYVMVIVAQRISPDIRGAVATYGWIVGAVLILCYLMALSFVRPVTELHRVVESFGTGNLQSRAHSERSDEIGALARAFDRMAERMQTLLVAERRLLLDISHELRSPLARLRLSAKLASVGNEQDRQEALSQIARDSQRLAALIGELLQVTRAEGDKDARILEEVDLKLLLPEVIAANRFEAEAGSTQIELIVTGDLTLQGDLELLRRSIDNVLRNAVRYAPPDSVIDVNAVAGTSDVTVTIRDRGPGVPESSLSELFRPFYRVEEDRSREKDVDTGVGLGLSIAERAILLHGGKLYARNAYPGLEVTMRISRGGLPPNSSD